ncbi:MAG: adenine phosphoribosyltransferase [Candidatus Omnitrophota bacterium]|nr:adenine phosphoribosyltransferase [Candidatus Omnitrophota bacterium]
MDFRSAIRDVPNFPKEGIVFKDITPLLKEPAIFRSAVDIMVKKLAEKQVDFILGIESRGFIFSPILAYQLNAGFIPVRKAGKLPWLTHQVAYSLEYGEAVLEIHQDSIPKGARVAIVDDLLATGGTGKACAELTEKVGGEVAIFAFLVELSFLKGREKLSDYDVFSLVQY